MRFFVCLLTLATLLSCEQSARTSQVAWDVAFGCAQDAQNAALVSLRILRGGCSSADVIYDERVTRAEDAPTPPVLDRGAYGFEAKAFDASDRLLAEVCETRTLPDDAKLQLELASVSSSCGVPDASTPTDDGGDAEADAAQVSTCGDSDQDGCDDCSYSSTPAPEADGPEIDGDGKCDCVVFADASVSGLGDGARWSTAFSRLQDAVDRAAELGEGCEVWARQGTYYSFRSAVTDGLVLRRGIHLFGGYVGGELSRDQRNTDPALTIIDGRSAESAAQRVTHVVTGAGSQIMNGFTIVGGDAAGTGDAGNGGGMINVEVADLTLRNMRFLVNQAALGGGAVHNVRSDVLMDRCTFEGNSSAGSGGAIVDESGKLIVRRSTFRDNRADDAQFGGGAIYTRASMVVIENALMAKNQAVRWGGAVLSETGSVRVTNCTVADNSAVDGGGLMGINGAAFTVKNSIIYGNAPNALRALSGAGFDVTYSNIEGGWGGSGNFATNPSFVDASNGNYRLAAGSPCIDAADGGSAPMIDLEGSARVDAPVGDTGVGPPTYVDIGAYEFSP